MKNKRPLDEGGETGSSQNSPKKNKKSSSKEDLSSPVLLDGDVGPSTSAEGVLNGPEAGEMGSSNIAESTSHFSPKKKKKKSSKKEEVSSPGLGNEHNGPEAQAEDGSESFVDPSMYAAAPASRPMLKADLLAMADCLAAALQKAEVPSSSRSKAKFITFKTIPDEIWTEVSSECGFSVEECKEGYSSFRKEMYANPPMSLEIAIFRHYIDHVISPSRLITCRKPLTPYNFFTKDYTKKLFQKHPGLTLAEGMQKTSKRWHKLSEEGKKPYVQQADQVKKFYELQLQLQDPLKGVFGRFRISQDKMARLAPQFGIEIPPKPKYPLELLADRIQSKHPDYTEEKAKSKAAKRFDRLDAESREELWRETQETLDRYRNAGRRLKQALDGAQKKAVAVAKAEGRAPKRASAVERSPSKGRKAVRERSPSPFSKVLREYEIEPLPKPPKNIRNYFAQKIDSDPALAKVKAVNRVEKLKIFQQLSGEDKAKWREKFRQDCEEYNVWCREALAKIPNSDARKMDIALNLHLASTSGKVAAAKRSPKSANSPPIRPQVDASKSANRRITEFFANGGATQKPPEDAGKADVKGSPEVKVISVLADSSDSDSD